VRERQRKKERKSDREGERETFCTAGGRGFRLQFGLRGEGLRCRCVTRFTPVLQCELQCVAVCVVVQVGGSATPLQMCEMMHCCVAVRVAVYCRMRCSIR